MNYSMITWCIIAAVLLCAFIFRAVAYNCAKLHGGCCRHKSKHFFELGRDTDIFYVPGDDEIPGKADKTDESDGREHEQARQQRCLAQYSRIPCRICLSVVRMRLHMHPYREKHQAYG